MTSPNFAISIEDVRAAMAGVRPGLRGQARMTPSNRLDPELYAQGSEDCRRAAVLLLLYPHQGELYTLLTVRPDHLPDHPGQIAFPGGSRDEAESVEETALREAYEEVGLDPARVEPLGRLTHIYIPPSHFCIQIVVGYTPSRPRWRTNPAEIADLLEIPLAHFFQPSAWRENEWSVRGEKRLIPYFDFEGHKVWGATAMALAEFVTLIEESVAAKTA